MTLSGISWALWNVTGCWSIFRLAIFLGPCWSVRSLVSLPRLYFWVTQRWCNIQLPIGLCSLLPEREMHKPHTLDSRCCSCPWGGLCPASIRLVSSPGIGFILWWGWGIWVLGWAGSFLLFSYGYLATSCPAAGFDHTWPWLLSVFLECNGHLG